MNTVVERFLKYVSFDTQSNENSGTTPSTAKQMLLAKELKKELMLLELTEITLDEYGYLMATLPANTDKKVPTIGFIAHLDTSPDVSGENVQPRIIHNYDGNSITLSASENIILSPSDFPELKNYIGQDLIVTDGKTLLGADDKAGIAEIITAIEYLQKHPEIKHGKIRIAFNPDEEIGMGASKFDVKLFGCDWAYTVDGGEIGELEYENFNAAGAKITIKGKNVHPGTAKNKMINASLIAMEFNGKLPAKERPEHTENYEGFYHLTGMSGTVEEATISYIIRDHDHSNFEKRIQLLKNITAELNIKYPNAIHLKIKYQYKNMREIIEPQMHIVDLAFNAMNTAGVKPKIKPIRGGTDGAQLSFKGLPCPNIFAGGMNFHGRYEYISIQSMEKAVEVIAQIAALNIK